MSVKKEDTSNKELKEKNKNLVEFFNGSFFVIPRNIIEARKKMRRASSFIIQDYFFAYFSSETGQRIGYKHFFNQQLAKELELDRGVFKEGLKEVEESGILKIFDFEHKGKIVFFENEYTQDLIEKIEAGKLFINIDMKLNIRISDKKLDEKIINFPSNEVEQIPPQGGANPTTLMEQIPPQGGANPTTLTNAVSFDWSTWEADLKNSQEAYIKEAYIKNHSIQEKELTDISNVKVETSKMNEVNDDKNKLINKNTEVESKVETSSEDLLKQKAIEKMTNTFFANLKTSKEESSAPGLAAKKITQVSEKSKDILELEDNFHSLGVKEAVYLKALGVHGYETCKAILDDMYRCLRFIQKNEMETIRNKGLYLTQRLEKLDNPEIKFGFICQPYEDTKTVKVKVVFDNEPKLLTKSKLMNEFLCFFHERANYAVNHLSIENKALDLATRVMSHFESTCKDLYSPEQREKTNYLLKSKNLPILEPFEQLIERKRLFFKSFKEKYNQEGIELLIDLVKLVNDPSLSLEKRNDFINWFKGI